MNEIAHVECFTVNTQDNYARQIQRHVNGIIEENAGSICVDVKMEYTVNSVLVMVMFENDS